MASSLASRNVRAALSSARTLISDADSRAALAAWLDGNPHAELIDLATVVEPGQAVESGATLLVVD